MTRTRAESKELKRRIVEEVREHPELKLHQIAKALGCSAPYACVIARASGLTRKRGRPRKN